MSPLISLFLPYIRGLSSSCFWMLSLFSTFPIFPNLNNRSLSFVLFVIDFDSCDSLKVGLSFSFLYSKASSLSFWVMRGGKLVFLLFSASQSFCSFSFPRMGHSQGDEGWTLSPFFYFSSSPKNGTRDFWSAFFLFLKWTHTTFGYLVTAGAQAPSTKHLRVKLFFEIFCVFLVLTPLTTEQVRNARE